jgi:hypothetical protein
LEKKVEKMNACIDRLIDESKALGQSSSQNSTALDMVKALGDFKNILINHPDARWGTPLNKSNKNLVLVTKQLFNPILGKIKTEFQMTALDVLGFNNKAHFVDIDEIQKWIDTISRSVNPRDEALLQIYSSFLGLIKLNYLPNKAYKKSNAYLISCKYCYRELWLTKQDDRFRDACHVHSDQGQKMGKYYEMRYKEMFIEINKMPVSEMPYSYMLNLLTLKKIPVWIPSKDDLAWIENLLRELDVCQKHSAAGIAQERYNELPEVLPEHYHRHWPISLNSTIIKYAAHTLVTKTETNFPSKKTAEILVRLWQKGKISLFSESELSEYDVEKKSLYPLSKRWGKVICSLRKSGLPESLIALTFNLKISDIKLAVAYYDLK